MSWSVPLAGFAVIPELLGTQMRGIYSMIIQQAVLMGLLGTVLGAMLEFASEPYFPRRV